MRQARRLLGLSVTVAVLNGCAQLSFFSNSSDQELPLPSSCQAYFALKQQLIQTELKTTITKPTITKPTITKPTITKPTITKSTEMPRWESGQCQRSRTNSHIVFTCAWQLQTLAAAKTYWRYQYDRLSQCFSGEWFHKVDALQASAYFRDDDKFIISLDRVTSQLDLNSNIETKFKKHQVHLSFEAYSPVLIGEEDKNSMPKQFY